MNSIVQKQFSQKFIEQAAQTNQSAQNTSYRANLE